MFKNSRIRVRFARTIDVDPATPAATHPFRTRSVNHSLRTVVSHTTNKQQHLFSSATMAERERSRSPDPQHNKDNGDHTAGGENGGEGEGIKLYIGNLDYGQSSLRSTTMDPRTFLSHSHTHTIILITQQRRKINFAQNLVSSEK